MKNLKLITLSLLLSASANALTGRALDDEERAVQVKDRLQKQVFKIKGVHGIGVTGCNPRTGKHDLENDFVHCVYISVHTDQAYRFLGRQFPRKAQIDGVFITVEKGSEPSPQPRMGGGN